MGVKELIAAIAAGGWVAVIAIVIICLIGVIIASPFGIFFSGNNRDQGAVTASAAVAQVMYDFNSKLEDLQDGDYDDTMEVKINREIRNYTESMFFGLSMRQFIFSVLAVGIAVLLYFVLKPMVGMETVSWMCILGAAPFAAMGFISYHGMTAEP